MPTIKRISLVCSWALLLGCEAPPASAEVSAKAPSAAPAQKEPGPARPRNVVLVTIDTLRADAARLYGGRVPTPVLERLAARGWTFERCYSASMLTNPSHASIMTSLYPRDHGVYDNESGVHDEARTLAQALSRAGMATAAVVNFPHLNPEVANLARGFDSFTRAERKERKGNVIAEQALASVDALEPGTPFFLWVHITEPHSPYEPEADLALPALPLVTPMSRAVRAAPGFQRNNEYFRAAFKTFKHTEELVRRYYAEVESADRALGVLVAGLEARGLYEATALVVTADHGENLGERELYFHHGGLHDETVHVPLVVSAPGLTQKRIAGLVETVDIAPTILELVGARRWEPMRGQSLAPIAAGLAPARAAVISEHMLGQLVAARNDSGLLISHRKSSAQFPSYPIVAGKQEFYELTHDPKARRPLPAEGPVAEALQAHLARHLGETPLLVAKRPVAQDRESLRALGYIE